MPRVLLTGKDWAARALVRAQLLEEGVHVKAYETARDALDEVSDLSDLPKLLVADLAGSPKPEAELDLLAQWGTLLPVWVIITPEVQIRRNLEEVAIERILSRPLDLGQLVAEIKQRTAG
jgi:CheY-like chemotaxis protein